MLAQYTDNHCGSVHVSENYACNLQEQHIREVAQHYFEAEDDSSRAGQSTAAGETDGLPLVAGSNFMAKDVRMLLRESRSMKACPPYTSCDHHVDEPHYAS